MRIAHDIHSHTSGIKISLDAETTNEGMLISDHKTDYGWSTIRTHTITKKLIISVGLLFVCVCVCVVIKMSPNVRYWTTISWKGDDFCLRLLFYYLVVHTRHKFYLLLCTMIAFHHISFMHFISFHSFSVIRIRKFSSVQWFNSLSCCVYNVEVCRFKSCCRFLQH